LLALWHANERCRDNCSRRSRSRVDRIRVSELSPRQQRNLLSAGCWIGRPGPSDPLPPTLTAAISSQPPLGKAPGAMVTAESPPVSGHRACNYGKVAARLAHGITGPASKSRFCTATCPPKGLQKFLPAFLPAHQALLKLNAAFLNRPPSGARMGPDAGAGGVRR
jgi:hypothetical protein